jgi:hypothetical protein
MAYYDIRAQSASGEPLSGRSVCVCGTGFFGGFSETVYTDRYGKAVVSSDSTSVTLYVDHVDRGVVRPGTHVVTIG